MRKNMNTAKFLGKKFLESRTIKKGDSVMFDIDNTLIERDTDRPIRQMIELLNIARNLGYKIIIITARPDDDFNQRFTAQQLLENNIKYNTLGFCPHSDKQKTKRYLKTTGHNFVLSVGDYWTDLSESDHWIKLPDENNSNFYSSIKL